MWERDGEMGDRDNAYVDHGMHVEVNAQLLGFGKSPSALTLLGSTQVTGLP